MCMSAVCAMSCSEDMLLSVQCATMERCLWLVTFCQRKDMSNHHRPRPVPLGKSHKQGKEQKEVCVFVLRMPSGLGLLEKLVRFLIGHSDKSLR